MVAGVLLLNTKFPEFLEKASPASAFLPEVNWATTASALRYQSPVLLVTD